MADAPPIDTRGPCSQVVPKPLILGLLTAALLFALVDLWHLADQWPGIDLYQFWAVGKTLRTTEVENVYSAVGRARVGVETGKRALDDPDGERHREVLSFRQTVETYSTPFLYSLFALLSPSGYETVHRANWFLSTACTLTAVWLFCRWAGLGGTTAMAVLLLLVGWFEPLHSDVRVGNVNQIQLAALALFCGIESRTEWPPRHLWAGMVLGLIVMFKPNTAYAMALWIWALLVGRHYRALGRTVCGVVAGVVVAILVSSWVFGTLRCWLEWMAALRGLMRSDIPVAIGNASPVILAKGMLGADLGALLPPLFMLPVLLAIWTGRRKTAHHESGNHSGSPNARLLIGMGCTVYCLSARLVWLHYLVLTLPVFIEALRPRNPDGTIHATRPNLGQGLGVLAVVLMSVGAQLELGNEYWSLSLMCVGCLILYGLGLRRLASDAHSPSSGP
jgi:hypothetical protein